MLGTQLLEGQVGTFAGLLGCHQGIEALLIAQLHPQGEFDRACGIDRSQISGLRQQRMPLAREGRGCDRGTQARSNPQESNEPYGSRNRFYRFTPWALPPLFVLWRLRRRGSYSKIASMPRLRGIVIESFPAAIGSAGELVACMTFNSCALARASGRTSRAPGRGRRPP